jgi:hypothetical protein
MSEFKFRIRITTAPQSRLNVAATELDLALDLRAPVLLKTFGEPRTIADSRELVVLGGPYDDPETAHKDGSRVIEAMGRAFASLRLGVDTAGFRAGAQFGQAGLEWLSQGTEQQILNDDQGLLVFDSGVPTRWAHANAPEVRIGVAPARLGRITNAALTRNIRLSAKEALSLELYHSSHFEQSGRARFLTLMIAIEAMLEPAPREPAALQLVDAFTEAVAGASGFSEGEQASLLGSLRYLRDDSISRTGRRLATARLGQRSYARKRADKFFTYCYDLRSAIVHRGQFDSDNGAADLPIGDLDHFVADLINYQLLDLDA